jgi:uncharacterized Tic20 family protein
MNMETPPPVSVAPPTGNDKMWSILSHLSPLVSLGVIFPLIVYLVMRKESEFAAASAKEALNFHISLFIYCLCCIPLVFIVIGVFLLMGIGLAALILAIIAAVKTSDGQVYRYPLTIRLVS